MFPCRQLVLTAILPILTAILPILIAILPILIAILLLLLLLLLLLRRWRCGALWTGKAWHRPGALRPSW